MEPWIGKAETALRTGQPRLAELYMRRGLAESPSGRSWLAWRDFRDALADLGLSMAYGWTRDQFALVGPSAGSTGVLP